MISSRDLCVCVGGGVAVDLGGGLRSSVSLDSGLSAENKRCLGKWCVRNRSGVRRVRYGGD